MAEHPPLPGPTLREKREKTVQLLIDSFASDRLTVEEFEARLDLAHRAGDLAALERLTSDLPAPAPAAAPTPTASQPLPRPAAPHPDLDRERQFLISVMGGTERKGSWTPAKKNTVLAMMGGTLLDFREAYLAPGVTEVEIFAMMGGVEIIVPPGVIVDSSGIAIMGSFAHGPGRPPGAGADTPVIRVGGFVFMGGVEIHLRLPGESAKDAKRRIREERKQLRRGQTDG